MKTGFVELHPAFVWDCPDCGRESFERSVVVELSPDEIEELREEHGVQKWEAGDFHTMPKSVRCQHCGFSANTSDRHFVQDEGTEFI